MKSFTEYLEESSVVKYTPPKMENAPLQVGDILVSTYGYNMTVNTFYKVIALTPTGKSARVVELKKKSVKGDGMRGEFVPTDEMAGKPITKRIADAFGKPGIPINRYEVAFRWNGKPMWEDHYD